MKVKLIRSEEQHNPEFVKAEHDRSVRAGRPYVKDGKKVPHYVRRPAGYEHEAEDAWKLCEVGVALPVDDEAKAMCKALGIDDQEIMRRHREMVIFENTVYDQATGKPVEEEDEE